VPASRFGAIFPIETLRHGLLQKPLHHVGWCYDRHQHFQESLRVATKVRQALGTELAHIIDDVLMNLLSCVDVAAWAIEFHRRISDNPQL
jgi:hypothetical protein